MGYHGVGVGQFPPIPLAGPHEIIALKRPFAACGKLAATIIEPSRIARSARMPLDKSVLLNSPFASPI
jgi:hypothetical protein